MSRSKIKFNTILTLFIITIALVSVFVIATPNKSGFSIPDHAVELSNGVFSLGTAVTADGRVVEGLMFVYTKKDFRKENGKPPWAGNGGKGGGEKCYESIVKGAKWKGDAEDYLVDASNNAGLNEVVVSNTLAAAIGDWEDAVDGSVDGVEGADILGDEVGGVVDRDNIENFNDVNEVMFADIDGSGTIAVTIVWGFFSGPPGQREIVEWNQVYDDVSFVWSDDGSNGTMDFENIAQHELGHSIGLGHPTSTCTEETMYAFASLGETKKRSLNDGDIAGAVNMYA